MKTENTVLARRSVKHFEPDHEISEG